MVTVQPPAVPQQHRVISDDAWSTARPTMGHATKLYLLGKSRIDVRPVHNGYMHGFGCRMLAFSLVDAGLELNFKDEHVVDWFTVGSFNVVSRQVCGQLRLLNGISSEQLIMCVVCRLVSHGGWPVED